MTTRIPGAADLHPGHLHAVRALDVVEVPERGERKERRQQDYQHQEREQERHEEHGEEAGPKDEEGDLDPGHEAAKQTTESSLRRDIDDTRARCPVSRNDKLSPHGTLALFSPQAVGCWRSISGNGVGESRRFVMVNVPAFVPLVTTHPRRC